MKKVVQFVIIVALMLFFAAELAWAPVAAPPPGLEKKRIVDKPIIYSPPKVIPRIQNSASPDDSTPITPGTTNSPDVAETSSTQASPAPITAPLPVESVEQTPAPQVNQNQKKSNIYMIVLIILILAAVAGGGGYVLINKQKEIKERNF